jgi:hypothetical protein
MCCFFPLRFLSFSVGFSHQTVELLANCLFGQTPPLVMGLFAFHGSEFENTWGRKEMMELSGFSLFGLFCWFIALLALWPAVLRRFNQATGRGAGRLRRRKPI